MPPRRLALAASLVAVALGVPLASPVEAAEVRLERLQFDCTRTQCPPDHGERLVVRGSRGEANRLRVARGPAGEFHVTDAGAVLRAGPGCTLAAEQLVSCPTSTPKLVAFVFAGDHGDTVTSSVAVNVDGGTGNDRLAGSTFADALYGAEGRDVARGNGGDDVLRDGRLPPPIPVDQYEGRFFPELLEPTEPVPAERDVFDGGAGIDTLGYEGRRRGVIADLARTGRHAGEPGEGDSLRGLERIEGGNGGDLLLGDDSANLLLGGEGGDRVIGRAGDDELELGAGSNRARGGAGDDIIGILGPDRHLERQRIACGLGRDRVAYLFRNDFASDDCESVTIGETFELELLLPPVSLRGPPLASFTTRAECAAPSCGWRLDVRLARSPNRRAPRLKGLLLGRASATVPDRAVTTVTVYLSARGSHLLRRYRTLLIRIHLDTAVGDPTIAAAGAYLTRLRAPAS